MQFDTALLKEKFPLINEQDIAHIQDFFNNPQTQTLLGELDAKRKKLVTYCFIGFPLLAAVVGAVVYFIYSLFPNLDSDVGFRIVGGAFGLAWYFASSYYKKISKSLKNDVLGEMFKGIDKNLVYGADPGSFHLRGGSDTDIARATYVEECSSCGLLQAFDSLAPLEDFTSYTIFDTQNVPAIRLLGFELLTKKVSGSGKNRREVVNNKAYIIHTEFFNPKKIFEKGVLITHDKENSFFANLFSSKKNKVQLENIEFEKAFDVFCDDALEARMLLTPSCMERLLNYAQKLGQGRIYEFYFYKNYFYVKNNLLTGKNFGFSGAGYLEFSPLKSFQTNILAYVSFVQELKYIQSLARDLKLEIYDKTISTTQVIPAVGT